MKASVVSVSVLATLMLLRPAGLQGEGMGTAFTYQGQLKQSGVPVIDSADMRFAVWDVESGGTKPVANPLVFDGRPGNSSPVDVVNGLFTISLDFGAFDFVHEYARWLEVAVRTPHDPTDTAPYTTLIPRQKLTPTPYAIRAQTAVSAETVLSHGHSLDAADGDPVDALLVNEDGNVGIGTTNPQGTLHLYDTSVGRRLILEGRSDLGGWQFRNPDDSFSFSSGASRFDDPMLFMNSYGNVQIGYHSPDPVEAGLSINGNVGVGTTAPWGKLNVGGDVRVGLVTEDDGSAEGSGDRLSFSGGDDWSEWDSDNSDPLWIARYNVSSNQTELRVNIGDDAEDVGEDITDAFVVGSVDAESETWNPRFTVQSTGNVGIGTTNPRAKLTIAGVGSDQRHGNSTIYLADANKYFDFEAGMVMRGTGHGWATRFTSTDNMNPSGEIVGIYKAESTAGDVANEAADVVATFKNDGTVGIGTTHPEGKLDVEGSVERVGIGGDFPDFWWDTFNDNGFWFTNRNGDEEGHTLFRWDNGISSRNILDLRNNGSVLVPDGNVGIGTVTPTAKLDVAGDIAVNGQTIVDSKGQWVGDPTGMQGPEGPPGPQGPPGPAVTTVAVCITEYRYCIGYCAQLCAGPDHVVTEVCVMNSGDQCRVTSDTGFCTALAGWYTDGGLKYGTCCVCRP